MFNQETEKEVKRSALLKERSDIGLRLNEISLLLKEIPYTKNAVQKISPFKLDATILANRTKLVKEKLALERRLSEIKAELKTNYNEESILKGILSELFTPSQLIAVWKERDRRMSGCPPLRVSIAKKDDSDIISKLRSELSESYAVLTKARTAITEVNRDGCSRFGNGEFLKVMSPVNTSIPSQQEIEKKKRLLNIR